MAIMDVLILLAVLLGLAYFQTPLIIWTVILGLAVLLVTLLGSLGFVSLAITWIIYLAMTLLATLKQWRLKYISQPFIRALQKKMPTMSETEREALEAGDVWWEKDLFCGRPQWQKLLAMPQAKLTAEEQAFLNNEVETLCMMLNDWQIVNKDHDLTPATWDYLKHKRFFGMVIPKQYGGRGFSPLAHSSVVTKIATRSISAAVNVMVPNSLGPGELVLHYGTDEQKEYYLPRLAEGKEIPCFALTGPEAGSDAGAITDSGVICHGEYQGKKIVGIRLNWDKRYITLAPIATVLGLAFRLYDPDQLLGAQIDLGITLCLIPTTHSGVEMGNRHLPLYMKFMNGPTRGKDVFIPLDWIIGGIAQAGHGWKMLMECLSIGRAISLPSLSTACGAMTYRMTGAYAKLRKQFNASLSSFEGIEEALSEIAGFTYQLESCRQLTCGALNQGVRPSTASAIAKYHMTEMARKVVDHAMDIHAGHMIQVGPRNFLAHAYMGIPISITVEGANILTRNLIIFGQGAVRCHPYLMNEMALFAMPDSAEKTEKLDKILFSHIGYTLKNFSRTWVSGLTGAYLISSPEFGVMAPYYRQLTRMSSALALLSDIFLLLLGGNLKRKENTSARLGDILSQLYLASAVLKYFNDQGRLAADVDYAKWCIETCLYKIQIACNELLDNFPQRWLGKIFRFIIFPFGAAYSKPQDSLSHRIVSAMIIPSEIRERITQACFIDKNHRDNMRRIEIAFAKINGIDPLLKKMQKIIKNEVIPLHNFKASCNAALKADLLTLEEVNNLEEFLVLYHEIIKVDEFSFDLNTVLT